MTSTVRKIGETALALSMGTLGGAIWWTLGLPAPWLSGALILVAALTLTPLPISMPLPLAQAAFILVGIRMGSGFNREMLEGAFKWPLSLVALAISVPLIVSGAAFYLRRYAKWDKPTAFFASIPGALSYVVAMTLASNADPRLVTLSQMLRLIILMAVLPFFVVNVSEVHAMPAATAADPHLAGPLGVVVLLLVGAASGLLLMKFKVPAGNLIGPMITCGALHVTGVVSAHLPNVIVVPSLVVIGTFSGLRFRGADLDTLKKAAGPALVAFAIASAIAGAFAAGVAWGLDLPIGQALIAFAPGGLDAMMILSFILGLDPAYVGTHQFLRFLGIAMLLPFVARPYLSKTNTNAVIDKTDPDD